MSYFATEGNWRKLEPGGVKLETLFSHATEVKYTLSIITSHILFGLGASLSLVNYAR